VELTSWRQLSDRGRDLVLCLDFPGGRAAAGFGELAAGLPTDACFLHIGQTGDGALTTAAGRWVAEVQDTGRPVRAVLGYCAGGALATYVADAIADTGPSPMVLLFDAVVTSSGSLADQFTTSLEASSEHLTAGELDDARELSEELAAAYPDDLPRVAAGLTDRYDRLMTEVAARLSLNDIFRRELSKGFAVYMAYLVLTGQNGYDMRTGDPLFLSSQDHQPPVDDARNVALDVGHTDLLRDAEVHKLVANLLTGEHPW
jgi:thioesterase domain-containing protein